MSIPEEGRCRGGGCTRPPDAPAVREQPSDWLESASTGGGDCSLLGLQGEDGCHRRPGDLQGAQRRHLARLDEAVDKIEQNMGLKYF